MDKLLYRVDEGGELLGLKRSKMYELIARGAIKVVKIDGATRIPAGELLAFAERLQGREPQTVA